MEKIVGESEAIQKLKEEIELIGQSLDMAGSVLITGERGTGKELVAQALHQASPTRNGKELVTLDCGTISRDIAESELFGYVKGAFTGATASKTGLIKAADEGVLFLDEVGNLRPALQGKFLRVLQEKAIRPVGGNKPEKLDFVVIAATNQNLAELADKDRFKRDLLDRLNIMPIHLPRLRDRKGDIPLLAKHLAGQELSPDIIGILEQHQWPGNVRELETVMKRAKIYSRGGEIRSEHIRIDWPAGNAGHRLFHGR